ncbi:hybrid sensor histidine kinase/response regulator transcription factor [Parabacteroides bouchesdurhonensis]|uniref:hybrid sensor histidine kinase/response regulator transcription factor n=1 Tax=Parabacteroides bouchesdurhonensis TaxID=1936995 RepID=UPI000E468215|nr:hybrid sensor histidine kinase/response regulator transcription factor [Parabacteroides bouchesdurhonensis]RHJ95349.1 hybrid sensor histidine kinase/response regulator [Bacteroides sp. AM07-16]
MRSFIFAIISIFCAFCYQNSTAGELYFKHYNNKHGLSHNTVFCSMQDRKGFMWFGTDDGLNRFDGYTFKTYRYNSWVESSLPGDRIISLYEGGDGKIWICTNQGTCYYDYKTDSFYPLLFPDGKNRIENFSSVLEDKENNLWCIEYNRIVKYSPENNTVQIYPAEKYFHPNGMILSDEGFPIFFDNNTIYTYKNETDSFDNIPILSKEEEEQEIHISVIFQIPEIGVLFGTDKTGLKIYHYKNRQIETIIPGIQVRAITAFNKSTYWIASESGVYIYNIIDKQIRHLQKSLTNEYTIADNAVYTLTKDHEGGMWVGTFFGGISYLPKEYTGFKYFIGGKTHPGMLGNAVREICPDQYGHLWLGTEDNGINCYNPQTEEMTNYSLNNPLHPLSATNIHGLMADGDRLWVGTFNNGIDVLDIPSGKIVKRYTRTNTHQNLISDFILCFCKTGNNDILIGTSSGTVLYNKTNDSFRPWKNIHTLTRQIYEDKKGRIWIITINGVYRYLPEEDKIDYYTSGKTQGLGSNNANSVFEDSKGRIWITTSHGFSKYDETTDSFNRITAENGLPSNIIYRIIEDDDHFFWISTANGLVKFNPETYVMRTYTYTDGLHEMQFNFSSSYKSPDGMIYMGTINGMLAFNPKLFREDSYTPPVYITNIHIPAYKKDKQGVKTSPIESSYQLKLPYNISTFTLSYIALSFTSPEAIKYAYKLEGTEGDWIYMNQNREVTFANLSPGSYLFKVKSTNSSGVWQDNEQTLQIIITPPFWATGWAMIIYVITLIICIAIFYYYKKAKLIEKHRINQEIFENKKEKELYNAKIQFFTFITHEIRTPLTLIKAPLEKILKSGDGTASTKENLKIIEKNTQRLLDLSNQLLDFRKTESKGFRLNYVRTDVKLWIETILQPFESILETEHKEFTITTPEHHLTAYIDREAFSKIISNLMTNAIKYSEKKIYLNLAVSESEKSCFTVTITNDGYLIPQEEKENIFTPFYRIKETENKQGSGIGLSLARTLAEFHSGTLIYRHSPDGLNQFVLTLPMEQKDCYMMVSEELQETTIAETVAMPKTGKPTVLIVEDQTDMRQFIAQELSGDYQVLEADNGETAFEQLKNNTVNLIISDVMMPIMDGFELCNKVKNDVNYSHIPFILLTAQHNLQSRLEGLNKGADAYMEKPFSIELLIAQIQNLLKNREILNKTYLEKPLTPTSSLAISPVDDIFLNKFNTCLDKHITNEALNVEMLASEMGMSTSSLYRKVKGLSGLSPVDFIKIARLKKAILLMQSGENRINEIAFQVGFSSPAYFSTCFQKQYGKSPSEFMKNIESSR